MNKTQIISIKDNFEADLIVELLKQNSIESEIKKEDENFLIFVSNIDLNRAKTIINNYNRPEEKSAVSKTDSLKSGIIKIFALVGGSALFYYIMSLLFKLILKLFRSN